jgi:hypothetical protein
MYTPKITDNRSQKKEQTEEKTIMQEKQALKEQRRNVQVALEALEQQKKEFALEKQKIAKLVEDVSVALRVGSSCEQGITFVWEWQEGTTKWYQYTCLEQWKLEQAFRLFLSEEGPTKVSIGEKYKVDVQSMTQENVHTGFRRSIRRRVLKIKNVSSRSSQPHDTGQEQDEKIASSWVGFKARTFAL